MNMGRGIPFRGCAGILALVLSMGLLLTGCAKESSEAEGWENSKAQTGENSEGSAAESAAAEASVLTYDLTFTLEGQTFTITANEGEIPAPSDEMTALLAEGEKFYCKDAAGTWVDPFGMAAAAEASFTGEIGLDLKVSAPFLSADENGFVHPEEAASAEDVEAMIESLVPAAKQSAILEKLAEEEKLVIASLGHLVEGEVPEEIVAAAVKKALAAQVSMVEKEIRISDLAASKVYKTSLQPFAEDANEETIAINRAGLAAFAYALAYPECGNFTFEDYPQIARDVDLKGEEADGLLIATLPFSFEAAVPGEEPIEEESTEEEAIEESAGEEAAEEKTSGTISASCAHQAILLSKWEEGPHLIKGYLYYADENGKLLRNERLGKTLNFDAECRYLSGDQDLDDLVAFYLHSIAKKYPEKNRDELLEKAFYYIRDYVIYAWQFLPDYADNDGVWVVEYGKKALSGNHYGDCYGFSSAFCNLARGLGYDAHAISGTWFGAPPNPHSWVMIEMDDEMYIFDPQLANREMLGMRDNMGYSMFKLPRDTWSNWVYEWENFMPDVEVYEPAEVEESSTDAAAEQEEQEVPLTNGYTPEDAVHLAKGWLKESVDLFTAKLGEPLSKEYSSSCMGEGEDGRWIYNGFVIYTYKEGDTEILQFAEVMK